MIVTVGITGPYYNTGGAADMKTEVESLSKRQTRALAPSVLKNLVFLILVDLALGFIAYFTAWIVRVLVPLPYTLALLPGERWDMVPHPWLLLAISQVFFLYIFGLYDDLRGTRYREILWYIFAACLLQMVTITSLFYFTNRIFPRSIIVLFDAANMGLLCLWRSYVRSRLKKQILRVLIVGEGRESAREIIQEIEKSPWMGMKIVGLLLGEISGTDTGQFRTSTGNEASHFRAATVRERAADDKQLPYSDAHSSLDHPVLGSLDQIRDIIVRYGIDEIIFTSERSWKDQVLNSISELQEETPVQIAILPSVYEIVIGKLRHINIQDTPLIEVKRHPNEPFERFIKRTFDVALSALGLLILLPFFLVVAVLIKVFSPGPVFYLQERVGYHQRIFRLVKFRTMVPDAEKLSGEIYATVNDPRVTPVGRFLRRFRIDELPQLLNVLKGDMSFVGPRPERPGFVKTFEQGIPGYHERHKIKPGVTGLAQVRSYYDTSVENKLKYDLAYIYNYGFSLDLLILLETIKVILIRRGS